MAEPARDCRIERRDGVDALVLEGDWRLERAAEIDRRLDALGAALRGVGRLDGQALRALDTAGALVLSRRLRAAGHDAAALAARDLSERHARVVALVADRLVVPVAGVAPRRRAPGAAALARLGASAAALGTMLLGHVSFLGRTAVEVARAFSRPGALRWRELASQLGRAGVDAIPVVALVTFLIGVVFAYLLGLQAAQFGANIFVVDGVALGMTREFSPLIVATIVAGRSGAAFTAQLGTMKLTEEIDAIRTLGLSAEQVLVVPRVLALMVALPLLVFVGDVAGLAGAMVIAGAMLDVTPHTFVERLHAELDAVHFLIGLGKAPAFALAIAVIGCRMGFDVARDTRSIGMNTTSTVVQGIVAVIVLDAVFAILFQSVGW